MQIMDQTNRIANFFQSDKGTVVLAVLACVLASGSFLLGRLSLAGEAHRDIVVEHTEPAAQVASAIEQTPNEASVPPAATSTSPKTSGKYVASKTGAAYHFPWCSGAKRIKEENKIYFDTKEAAEQAGYHPAGNCKGL